MKVKLTNGEEIELLFGAALAGLGVESITLNKRDADDIRAGFISESKVVRALTADYLTNLTTKFPPI